MTPPLMEPEEGSRAPPQSPHKGARRHLFRQMRQKNARRTTGARGKQGSGVGMNHSHSHTFVLVLVLDLVCVL